MSLVAGLEALLFVAERPLTSAELAELAEVSPAAVDGAIAELATALVTAGHKLTLFKEDELNLEGAFMALTKGITA